MNSPRNTFHANDEDSEEKIQDNRQLSRDPGQKEELDENGPKSLIMEIYPWISQFKKMCRSSLEQRSISSLKTLMTFYARNIRPSVNECRTKPLRAEKLKDSIGETLLFFLYYHRDVGNCKDRDYYLIVMSDLVAMYIDMELKASKKVKEHCSKISARLSSCLHVYLEHSAEHLLDTLLKVHFMNHNYHEILDPVITKIFKIIDDHPSSSIMYVRYLLAYRLWKKLNKDVAIRNQINVIALTSLGIAPNDFPSFIVDNVLPQVPKTQKISTKMLLLQKFEVEKSCEEFFNFCNKERGLESAKNEDESCLTSAIASLPEDNNDCRELINNNNNSSIVTKQVTLSIKNSSVKQKNLSDSKIGPSVSKIKISSNLSSLRRTKKSNDIVIIDLTSDSITEKIIKNKKNRRRKLLWLEEAKKRINAKIIVKKDCPIEDSTRSEDCAKLKSLQITELTRSTSSKMDIFDVDKVSLENEERAQEEIKADEVSSRVLSIDSNHGILCTVTNGLVNKLPDNVEWRQLESQNNEKNRFEAESILEKHEIEVSPSFVEVSSVQADTSALPTDNCTFDEYPSDVKIHETGKLPVEDEAYVTETLEKLQETSKELKDKIHVKENVTIQSTIKPELLNVKPDEIINDSLLSIEMEVQVAKYDSEVTLDCEQRKEPEKCREVEFQENIDGLSLLASVSQRISHLTTDANISSPVELIKVKNYASLANPNIVQLSDTSNVTVPYSNDPNDIVMNEIVNIYTEDAMEKVAYQVEVTSTDDTDTYESCDRFNGNLNFSKNEENHCNTVSQSSNSLVTPETANLVEKDDNNVILNGETVVLYQKSPNSNLYIINKAVENRDHPNDDITNSHRDINEQRVNDTTDSSSYELYDGIYCNQASNYDISQYNRDLSSQESRRAKVTKIDQSGETSEPCDSSEITKSGNILDVISDKARIKRKLTNSSMPRRRRIKQEYNGGCSIKISGHMDSSYVIDDCSQEHQDNTRSIHIPVAHTATMSSMYAKYTSSADLYLPCHENCNSITCGLSVNSNASLHSHTGNNTNVNSRCTCLNCTYGIVTHCTECIMPNGETRGTSIDPNSYYMPLLNPKNSNIQDCKITRVDDKLSNIYDEQLVRKFGQKIMDVKPLESVKLEAKDIYRAEFDNKLPLKKRFKAIMSMSYVNDSTIKCEKIQSYPSTPMLSIAALESSGDKTSENFDTTSNNENSTISASKHAIKRGETDILRQSREMIRRDYRKDTIMSTTPTNISVSLKNIKNLSGAKRKRGKSLNPTITRERDDNCEKNVDKMRFVENRETIVKGDIGFKSVIITPSKSQARPSEKVKEPENIPGKISTRKTRSSKRNIPKVNYIYADGDSDWNPSGNVAGDIVTKRKRKKTSR